MAMGMGITRSIEIASDAGNFEGVSSRSSNAPSLQFVGLRNALDDFGDGIVALERLRIDRAICREAIEKAIQIVADPCREWYAYFRRKQLRQPHHVVRVFADVPGIHGLAFRLARIEVQASHWP